MTNRLDRLEEAGLIKRLPDPDDRRGVQVELTPGRTRGVRAVDDRPGATKEALVASALARARAANGAERAPAPA